MTFYTSDSLSKKVLCIWEKVCNVEGSVSEAKGNLILGRPLRQHNINVKILHSLV